MRTLLLTCLLLATATSARGQQLAPSALPTPPPPPPVSSVCLTENLEMARELMRVLLNSTDPYYAESRTALGLPTGAPFRLLTNDDDDDASCRKLNVQMKPEQYEPAYRQTHSLAYFSVAGKLVAVLARDDGMLHSGYGLAHAFVMNPATSYTTLVSF